MIAHPMSRLTFLARAVATAAGLLGAGAGLAIMAHLIRSLAAASGRLREQAPTPAAATGEAPATHQLEEATMEVAATEAASAAKADEAPAVPIVAAAPVTATTQPREPNHSAPATASGRGAPTTAAPSDLPEVAITEELKLSAAPWYQAVRNALSMEAALVHQMGGPGEVAAGIPRRSGEGEMQPRLGAIRVDSA